MRLLTDINRSISNLKEKIRYYPRRKIFYLTTFSNIVDWTFDHETPCSEGEEILAFAVINALTLEDFIR